jgi:hypothetical protein
MKTRLHKPTPALAVSVMALVVALGGTSYAAGLIGSADIRDDSVRSIDVKDGTLRQKDLRFDATGPVGPAGPEGPAGTSRWLLVNADGEIEAQSGGFSVTAAYPVLGNTAVPPADNSLRANGNVYINAGEDLTDNGIVATIALQNTLDQNGDGIVNGRAPQADANPEFSGEIGVSICGLMGTACAPPDTGNTSTFVVSPRLSDGTVTTDDNRKRFYVVISGDSSDMTG